MFDSWNDRLSHSGILGMKWGRRRYQNKDGSLTEEGKRRVRETAGNGYLNPPNMYSSDKRLRKEGSPKKTKERALVSVKYDNDYWNAVEKHGMPMNEPSEIGKKIWDKYKTAYASATLKDLKLADTRQARREVKRILAEIDPDYNYNHVPDYGYDVERYKRYG